MENVLAMPKMVAFETEKTKLIEKYTKLGINSNKIIVTTRSIVLWSLMKKQIIDYKESSELIKNRNLLRFSQEKSRTVNLELHPNISKKDVIKINESEGIIVSTVTYGKPYYRYGFIPSE